MNRFLSKRSLYSIIGLAICLGIIYYTAYTILVQPMQVALTSTNKSLALFEAQVEKLESQPNDKVRTDEKGIEATIPGSEQPNKILLSIEKFALNAKVNVNSIKTEKLDDRTDSKKMPEGIKENSYTLEGTATSLENANAFLSLLKKSNRLFLIDKLTVNKNSNAVSFIVTFTGFHDN